MNPFLYITYNNENIEIKVRYVQKKPCTHVCKTAGRLFRAKQIEDDEMPLLSQDFFHFQYEKVRDLF